MAQLFGCLAIMKNEGRYLFGWTNIKWFIKEVVKTMSDQSTYFSKKRVQEWILFITAWVTSLVWFVYHFKGMDIGTLLAYTGTLFVYAGYQTIQIQREKKKTNGKTEDEEELS